MSRFTFEDFVASLTSKMKSEMQPDADAGHISQERVDEADFFELTSMDMDPCELHDLMEKAFKAGQNSL